MGEKSDLFNIHFITEAEIKGEEDMTKVKWNSVEEVGFPKDLTKYYYVTYKDSEGNILTGITKFFDDGDGEDILADSLDVNDDGILAWAEMDVALPEPYVQKEETTTDKKDMTIGDYIRQASDLDIASMIGMYITEYNLKNSMHGRLENLLNAFTETLDIAEFVVKICKELSNPYYGSVYEKADTSAKEKYKEMKENK